MKNTIILLLVFAILAGGAYWLKTSDQQQQTQMISGDRDFAIQNVDQIGKVFIADRKGHRTTLTRDGNSNKWTLNGKYRARKGAIANLMQTIKNVEMKNIPNNAAIPNIVETLGSHGIKVEIYDRNNEIMKTYYVGGMTNNEKGTYMIMEGAEQPYVVHMPQMEGGLRVRYLMSEDNWRDRHLFGIAPEDIQYVSVEYPKQRNKSFTLEKTGDQYDILPFYDITPTTPRPYKKGSAEAYLIGFEQFFAENYINHHKDRDSISQLVPFAIVTVKDETGEEQTARFHPLYPLDNDGTPLTDDEVIGNTAVEHYHVNHSKGDYYLVQQRQFGRAFWSYDSFFDNAK